MKKLYLITGANGHLGSALCTLLAERGEAFRALVLPGEDTAYLESCGGEILFGDVRSIEDLEAFFAHGADERLVVVHAAGIVDINCRRSARMEDVNLNGARNVVELCRRHSDALERLVYVSSVHAVPEPEDGGEISEVSSFSPDRVVGAYAKTKAAATQIVLDSVREGVPAVVVHPSGIIGPLLGRGNHLVQLITNYLNGTLAGVVRGGYDFVDVRDVALGCLAAAEKGRIGECYLLSNRYFEIRDVISMLREIAGGKKVCVFPLWMAKMAAGLLSIGAKRRKKKPLFTKYSLYTLKANGKFSHEKAELELGYRPRDLQTTLKDTAAWLIATGEVRERKVCPHSSARRLHTGN